MSLATASPRRALFQRGVRLEYLTVGWNLVEGREAFSGEDHDG